MHTFATSSDDTASSPVLDEAMLAEVTGGDPDLIRELAELYISDSGEQLESMERALAARDIEGVGRIAHGLKGASASIGAEEARAAFLRLEELGAKPAADEIPAALAEARSAYGRVCERLRTLA